jgi:hypothetical protein
LQIGIAFARCLAKHSEESSGFVGVRRQKHHLAYDCREYHARSGVCERLQLAGPQNHTIPRPLLHLLLPNVGDHEDFGNTVIVSVARNVANEFLGLQLLAHCQHDDDVERQSLILR